LGAVVAVVESAIKEEALVLLHSQAELERRACAAWICLALDARALRLVRKPDRVLTPSVAE
jgi:hypothetical protein